MTADWLNLSPASNMAAPHASQAPRRTWWWRATLLAMTAIAMAQGYIAVFRRDNDFGWHLDFGKAFLAGEPYRDSGVWYPLARAMFDGMLALLPVGVARAACYLAALAALGWCFGIWRQLADVHQRVARQVAFPAGVLTLLIYLPHLLRDLDECGLQIFLLLLLSLGGWALAQGRAAAAGFFLATAVAYKVTPLLTLPYLVWKRQWRAASWMCVFGLFWAMLPAVYLGWNRTWDGHRQWLEWTRMATQAPEAYPGIAGYEDPKPQNLSLAALAARYVETYPPGHPLHLEHPLFFQFGNLSAPTAKRVVQGVLLLLAAALAWRFRRGWARREAHYDLAAEWAVVCLLCCLAAPICWKQHLMLALPCLFLVVRRALSQPERRGLLIAVLAVVAAITWLCRHGAVGRELSIVLLSYKLDTMAALALMACALVPAPAKREGAAPVPAVP